MRGGEIIKVARKARGYTQEQIAEQCGVSVRALRNYELGYGDPRCNLVKKILDHLGLAREEIQELGANNDSNDQEGTSKAA